ncbi:alpha/beta hydrolase [Lagierella sp. ICN-221743]
MKRKIIKILQIISKILLGLILLVFCLHLGGSLWNNRTPKDGINESMYIDINGSKQWINIYGKNKNNPVLLYLHGGPGSSTSEIDYAFTRKWSDIYTVVTWDQRNCGKSYNKAQDQIELTKEMLLEDGKEITEFIISHMGVDKISILGHSWGSIYGANLVLEYPKYYDLFIGCGQLVDIVENEEAFKSEAIKWAKGNEETMKLIEKINSEKITVESIEAKNEILNKYGYGIMKDGFDYCPITTILFNPNYSIRDWFSIASRDKQVYLDFFKSDELKDFSLKGKYEYQVPYININGDMDYQVNYKLAEDYFNKVIAPQKELYIMNNTTHALMISKSQEFSDILHDINKKFKR